MESKHPDKATPAELPRTSLDNVLIELVEGMVYSSETHEQLIPRSSRLKKTLTFRQLLFESSDIEERDVTEHMGVVGPTVDGYKLAYIDGRISDDANVDFCIMKHKKVIAKVEMKLIKASYSADKDFGAKELERQMLLVAEGRHSKSVVNKGLEGNYGIVAEHVDGGDRGPFGDVKQIALFKWDGQKRKPILFCFIPVWRPSTSEGASSGGGGSSGSGVGGKRKDGGSSGSSKKAKA